MAPQPKGRGAKAKSGNPAKRAQQEREALMRAAGEAVKAAPAGAAFGLGGKQDGETAEPPALEIPPGLEKFLGR